MLIARNFISRNLYEVARKKQVRKFLFNEIDFIPPEGTGEVFINCTKYRVESTWYTWNENDKIIEKFKQKFPQLFTLNSYDITLAIKKAMFWSNYKTGFLWYAMENDFPGIQSPMIDPLHGYKKSSVIFRYLKVKASRSRKQVQSKPKVSHKPSKVIHIKSNFQLGLYTNIINQVEKHSDYLVFIDSKVNKEMLKTIENRNVKTIGRYDINYQFPSVNLSQLQGSDWYVLQMILLHWNEINECLQIAEQLVQYNPKITLLNEAENGIYGAIVSEVLRKNGSVIYNTMNGIKSGESQDGFINFDKWFVWDIQMKNLLIKKCRLPEDMFVISGHLIEDNVRNYQFQNSLNIDLKDLEGKKVISLFSVKGKRFVKLDTLTFLYDFLKKNDNYFLLIRPHPHEKKEDYILPDFQLNNFKIIEYNAMNLNDTLHDQLSISDVSIVFGSTVSLDSKWMNVPCITYERREESLIYNIDNESIFHVKSREELEYKIQQVLQMPKQRKNDIKSNVYDIILNEINQSFNELLQA